MTEAQNAILIEIVPDDPEIDLNNILEEIKSRLPENVTIKDHKIEPFVFGINKLKIMLVAPEEEGLASKIESIINSMQGVTAEVLSITRL